MKKEKVFVGLSGGVDSSVAALRLIKAGYDVTGVFIKVWHPDFLVCNWEQERLDAMRVAAHLDIPFLTCDAEAAYRDEVAKYFISEYIEGRTPNPDVMCNKHVKFGSFFEFAKQHGADYIATGHYAQKINLEGKEELHRGIDTNKDQSYFLYSLSQRQLDYALLPVGSSTKDVIRKEAEKAGIPTAAKKDSQGVCFLGHIDIGDFLSHYVKLHKGSVVTEKGEVVGEHNGALIYTIGQRHGFTINTSTEKREAYFVIGKDIEKNQVIVSSEKPLLHQDNILSIVNLELRTNLETGVTLEVQTRYRQKPFAVKVHSVTNEKIEIVIQEECEATAKGQSCVFYQGDICLGGGIIA